MQKQRFTALLLALLFTSGALADYEDGLNAAEAGDFATAYREFLAAAEEGLMMAQYNLGILYFLGRGVEQDYEQAFRWTSAAAEQGHVASQFNLGALYYEGNGVRRDKKIALEWYSKAGDGDHAFAQFNVASMYYQGDGVEKDLVQAHAWASRAVENDHETAAELVEEIESKLSDSELSEARRLFARMKIGF